MRPEDLCVLLPFYTLKCKSKNSKNLCIFAGVTKVWAIWDFLRNKYKNIKQVIGKKSVCVFCKEIITVVLIVEFRRKRKTYKSII